MWQTRQLNQTTFTFQESIKRLYVYTFLYAKLQVT